MSGDSQWLAWWQLLRAGNVFTAVSNILAGYLLARGECQPIWPLVFLILSSACLYLAGMVLNDVFDLENDRIERPNRPLPSGRIELATARLVGWGLLVDGLSAAAVVAWLQASWEPLGIATLLAGAIVGYDARLKNTPLGPATMGACRSLNVLLGASALTNFDRLTPVFYYAAVLGIYTLGLTLLAQTEAEQGRRPRLVVAGWICKLAILALAGLTWLDGPFMVSPQWLLGVAACLLLVIPPLNRAAASPSPANQQAAVVRLITMFIPLDALVCTAVAGWWAGLIVLGLLVPTYIASRRVPMT